MSFPVAPAIPPSEDDTYAQLPYHYDRSHDNPETIVRIPIAGPKPFNTLVYFRWRAILTPHTQSNGRTHHKTSAYQTPLFIKNYDPNDLDHKYCDHSSTATISMNQITPENDIPLFDDGNTDWTAAIDIIAGDAEIDHAGQVSITLTTAERYFQVNAAAAVNVSTWALIYEQ